MTAEQLILRLERDLVQIVKSPPAFARVDANQMLVLIERWRRLKLRKRP